MMELLDQKWNEKDKPNMTELKSKFKAKELAHIDKILALLQAKC